MYLNLYVKTEYSYLDSLIKIDDYINFAVQNNFKALAICDTSLAGSYAFYSACKANNINPIIGLEAVVQTGLGSVTRLLLFAKNKVGYYNLIKISSMIETSNNHAIGFTELLNYASGLRVISTDASDILRDFNRSTKFVEKYVLAFEEFYIGIDNKDDQKTEKLLQIATETNVKPIYLHETRMFNAKDLKYLVALQAVKQSVKFNEIASKPLEDFAYYSLLPERNDDVIYNNTNIFLDTNIEIDDYTYKLPNYSIPYEKKEYLKALSFKGLERRLRNKKINLTPYLDRLAYELNVINQLNFTDYFLICYDLILYAKRDLKILVGPGRGSASGSLVSYCLGITNIDPLEYGLVFERFLNKDRVSMPDIDIDLPDDRRIEVVEYLMGKYGKDKVNLIQTFNRFQGKSSLRDMARVLDINVNRFEEVLKELSDFSNLDSIKQIPNIGQLIQENDDIALLFDFAFKIEGQIKSTSTHAAGIIISDKDITNYAPITIGVKNMNQIQFDAVTAEKIGLLKMDLLSLRNLTIIKKTLDKVQENGAIIDLNNINLKDQKTFDLISSGNTLGIFQLESRGISTLVKNFGVNEFNDIPLCLAMYRPGPMDSIPQITKAKKDKIITYLHQDLEPILKETYGFILYQEQIIKILATFGNFNYSEADVIRKAISKKNVDLMLNYRSEFIERGKAKYDVRLLEELYDSIVKFASYGFNKSHAVSYSFITYYTAYLKANYPIEYLTTMIDLEGGKISDEYRIDFVKLGIKLERPDINNSSAKFIKTKEGVLLPLTSINLVNESVCKNIIEERAKGPYKSYIDFLIRTNTFLSDKIKRMLIYSGALDSFGLNKATLIQSMNSEILNTFKNQPNILIDSFIKNVEEYDFDTLQIKEKEALNFNISYNFYTKYAKIITGQRLHCLNDLKSMRRIMVLAKVVGFRKIYTKTNQEMCFIDIEDNTDFVNVVVFPNVFTKVGNSLKINEVLVFDLTKDEQEKSSVVLNDIRILKRR